MAVLALGGRTIPRGTAKGFTTTDLPKLRDASALWLAMGCFRGAKREANRFALTVSRLSCSDEAAPVVDSSAATRRLEGALRGCGVDRKELRRGERSIQRPSATFSHTWEALEVAAVTPARILRRLFEVLMILAGRPTMGVQCIEPSTAPAISNK